MLGFRCFFFSLSKTVKRFFRLHVWYLFVHTESVFDVFFESAEYMKAGCYQMLVECVSVCIHYSSIMICLDQRTKLLNYMRVMLSHQNHENSAADFFQPIFASKVRFFSRFAWWLVLRNHWVPLHSFWKGLLGGTVRKFHEPIALVDHDVILIPISQAIAFNEDRVHYAYSPRCRSYPQTTYVAESKKCQLAFLHVKKVYCLYNTPPFPSISYP